MKAKYARQIRIGIMFRCRPTMADTRGARYDYVDMGRLNDYQYDYFFNGTELSRRAAERTKEWRSVRYKDELA